MGVNSLPKTVTRQRRDCDLNPGPSAPESSTMGVNSLPKTGTRRRRDCDLNPGLSAPESSTLTTRLPSRSQFTLV